ncbi:MAG: tRNA (adenosine(37)-N6)-threonylcarbamoyltransferase complex transferase subunit TsaD [Phycisphaeraceae bacterium]|nr:tRNA (adenosine(37)-N6)-threonylcarbamoyltransferase complex transferase subunit TsaD [Phycisphaeraceae bacterium]
MLILAIETSCDETAAAVVEDGHLVLSNVIASQHDLHAEYAGVVPELASRAHSERVLPVVRKAISEAGINLHRVDAIAVGNRPGLIGSLLVGVAAAKALAWSLAKPLIGVDHVHAHLYSGLLGAGPGGRHEANFPALGLVVSGGHTALYHVDSPIDVRRLGSTIDDAVGEAFDKAATILGLPYPGGPNLDRLTQTPGADDRAFDFPVSRIAPDSLDFSFSGLKTSLLYAVRGVPQRGGHFLKDHTWLSESSRADLAASFQRAAVGAVILKLQRAVQGGRYRSILAGGGVTANSLLRRRLDEVAKQHSLALFLPPLDLCVDNAAMIAGVAYHLLSAGRVSDLSLQAMPTTSC